MHRRGRRRLGAPNSHMQKMQPERRGDPGCTEGEPNSPKLVQQGPPGSAIPVRRHGWPRRRKSTGGENRPVEGEKTWKTSPNHCTNNERLNERLRTSQHKPKQSQKITEKTPNNHRKSSLTTKQNTNTTENQRKKMNENHGKH